MRGWMCALLLPLPLAAPGAAPGQDQPPLFMIHQNVVKPSMVEQYEAAAKDFVAMVMENRAAVPELSYQALVSDDFVYSYVFRVPNFAGIDSVGQAFAALALKAGPRFAEVGQRSAAATEYHSGGWVVSEAPELSYTPAARRLRPEEVRFLHFDVYYVTVGREEEADAVAKEFLALFKSKSIANGYRVYRTAMAPEMPAIMVEVGARDAADFTAQSMSDRAALGEAGKALFAKAFAITRRFESRSCWLRLDLSVLPAPAPPEK